MNSTGPAVTARGWCLVAGALAMAAAGWLFGLEELYALAVAAVLLVIAALIRVAPGPGDLAVSRRTHPARVPAGGEARVELMATNLGRRRTPPLSAADAFDGGRRHARFAVAPLEPGESRRASYRLPTSERGVHHLGPLLLHREDPLGLARRSLSTAPDTALIVHPRFDTIALTGPSAHRDEERVSSQPLFGKGGNEFFSLRQYVPGDDVRRVHWPTSARVDDLVLRQEENLRRGRLTVVVDLRDSVQDQASLERCLSAAASVATSALDEGLHVRLVTTGGFDSGHRPGRDQAAAILDALAAATAHRPRAAAPFRVAGPFDPVIVVTTDRVPQGDIAMAVSQGAAGTVTVVLFATGGPPPAGLTGALVVVGRDEDFGAAWRRRELSLC